MEIFVRRNSSSSCLLNSARSRPSKRTCPAEGRLSRLKHRTRVDLPEPDRPMMTKIFPFGIFRLMSHRATVTPVFLWTSAFSPPASIIRTASWRLSP